MKTKNLEIILSVFENDTKTTYKYGFKNQKIIQKLMDVIVEQHSQEMFDYMFKQ